MSGDIPKIQLDQDAISRVLINLIKNAIEARKDKSTLNIKIKTLFKPKEGLVQLTIIDDGKGFPAEIIDHVFEPYITTKEKVEVWVLLLCKISSSSMMVKYLQAISSLMVQELLLN